MKKFLIFILILSLLVSSVPTLAANEVTVELDGNVIECKDANGNAVAPLLIDGSTFLPVRAIANALNLDVAWDDATKSVFINGISVLAKKTDVINIFINGAKFIAKDVNGNVVNPVIVDGTTFLPVRAIGEAFNKEVLWEESTKTVKLISKPEEVITKNVIEYNKTYALINKSTGKALTATDHNTIVSEEFNSSAEQAFVFTISDYDGFYFIRSVSNGQNFDVSGHSVEPGGEIITWDATYAENQMFGVKDVVGGAMIYPYTSSLALEPSAVMTIQNTKKNDDIQIWEIKEFDAPKVELPKPYRKFTTNGLSLSSNDSLKAEASNNLPAQKWRLVDMGYDEYVITNLATNTSIDVSGQSLNAGDPIITWETSSDPNQRWNLEKQSDDTYLIKSVHSGLYLTVSSDNTIIQTYKNSSLKQNWTITETD